MVNADALALMKEINRSSKGGGSAVLASSIVPARRFTTGSLTLDVALGGGWPGNAWHELYGKESHGKSTVALKTVAANQALDPNFITLWVASEDFNKENAEALGVDTDRVVLVETRNMEYAYEEIIKAAGKKGADLLVLDSYPALLPGEEYEKDMASSTMAVGARVTGKFFRKVGDAMARGPNERPVTGIFVNQQRDNIGGYSPVGVAQTTPGGNGKNYSFNVRLQVSRSEYIKEKVPDKGEVKVGQVIKALTVKNKSAPPQQVAIWDFYFRDAPILGFKRGEYDSIKEIRTLALVYDVVDTTSTGRYEFGGQKWHGKEALTASLYEDLTLRAEITKRVMEFAGKPRQDAEEVEGEAA